MTIGHTTSAPPPGGDPGGNPEAVPDTPPLYTAEQAAELLQVPVSWLRRKATARAVPCVFLGKHLRFTAHNLEMIIQGGACTPTHQHEQQPTPQRHRRP
ncbi:MAG: helix-turn-helix domain-containing protein [Dactylosporangium sp.]|nr:helix-turn-helix domain-containing protein [Dactylosporangium sp.]NNJ60394.1 helix-turn-helix domain-containing protein [Dactylosporangium sp.]